MTQKKAVKADIIKAVDTLGVVEKSKLIAEICLNTGFKETTINKILAQMAELKYINIDGDVVSRPGVLSKWECPSCGNIINLKGEGQPERCACGREKDFKRIL